MASSSKTLLTEIAAVLPRCVSQLADSHHLQVPPKSALHEQLRSYNYEFLANSAWRPVFGEFTTDADSHRTASGEVEDQEIDGENGWSLSSAQARGAGSGLANEYSRARKGMPCGHVFQKGETVYRCK